LLRLELGSAACYVANNGATQLQLVASNSITNGVAGNAMVQNNVALYPWTAGNITLGTADNPWGKLWCGAAHHTGKVEIHGADLEVYS